MNKDAIILKIRTHLEWCTDNLIDLDKFDGEKLQPRTGLGDVKKIAPMKRCQWGKRPKSVSNLDRSRILVVHNVEAMRLESSSQTVDSENEIQ